MKGELRKIGLQHDVCSGLGHGMRGLDGQPGIAFSHFQTEDVVRHPRGQAIVQAYEEHEKDQPQQ